MADRIAAALFMYLSTPWDIHLRAVFGQAEKLAVNEKHIAHANTYFSRQYGTSHCRVHIRTLATKDTSLFSSPGAVPTNVYCFMFMSIEPDMVYGETW